MHYGGISIAFNWRNYLNLAKDLETGTDEARLRSSISRAYYASYCSARNYMIDTCGSSLPYGEKSHEFVIEYYNGNKGGRTTPRRSKIAQKLLRMKLKRVSADYYNNDFNAVILHSEAKFVLTQSNEVIEEIERPML
jgi:uncharacterized protein (UPF0332 family)